MAKNTNTEPNTTTSDENSCNVDKSLQVLSQLYKNVTMAQNAVNTILPFVQSKSLTQLLRNQADGYGEYVDKVEQLSQTLNFDPTPATQLALSMAGVGIRMKMTCTHTDGNAAKIVIQGTLNGLIDLYRLTKQLDQVHPQVSLLVRQALSFEEGCFENLKSQL